VLTSSLFFPGQAYTRKDIYRILGVPEGDQGGDWDTGCHRRGHDFFIFANVGVVGRSGPGYGNRWDGAHLRWEGRTGSTLRQPRTQALLSPQGEVLLFWRTGNRDPFTFAGPVRAVGSEDVSPVVVLWAPVTSPAVAEAALDSLEGDPNLSGLQGIEPSVAERRAIERHAMDLATTHYQRLGYTVQDVSLTCSFDLLCSNADGDLRIEVKGTRGSGASVRVTAGEVRSARAHAAQTALFVVSAICLERTPIDVVATGGKVRIVHPWNPTEATLEPVAFVHKLPAETS
jgi:hypothetical protein